MRPGARQDPCVLPQVIQGCGNPKVNPQGPGTEEKWPRGKLALQERPPAGTLQKLVSGLCRADPGWRGGWRWAGQAGRGTWWPDHCSTGLRSQGPAPRRSGLLDQPPGNAVQ